MKNRKKQRGASIHMFFQGERPDRGHERNIENNENIEIDNQKKRKFDEDFSQSDSYEQKRSCHSI
jgi:hypothetical protein